MTGGFCAECGQALAEGAKFCGKCGASRAEPPPIDRKCLSCGTTPNDVGDRFCSGCGQPLPSAARRCSNASCGQPVGEGFKFCPACGTGLAAAQPPPAAPMGSVATPRTSARPSGRRPAWIALGAVLLVVGLVGLGLGVSRQLAGMGLAGGYRRSPATPTDDKPDIESLVEAERKKQDEALAAEVAKLGGSE